MIDGIGDYTALLAAELAKSHTVRILTSDERPFTPIPNVEILAIIHPSDHNTYNRLFDAVDNAGTDWAVLQYNPFGFGRRGYNATLPRVMQRISSDSRKTKVAMMSHETYVRPESVKLAIMRLWQRGQFRQLLHACSVSFFSVEFRIAEHRAWEPALPMIHLPVGANIPRVAISRDEARSRIGIGPEEVVLGVFGQAHISRSFEPVRQTIAAIRAKGLQPTLLYIGPDGAHVKTQVDNVKMIVDGPHPADEVSRRLSAIDVFIAMYSDGITTRRGAFIAALRHGLPIVATKTVDIGPVLAAEEDRAFFASSPHDTAKIVAEVMRLVENRSLASEMGRNAEALYDRVFSWPVIAEKILAGLTAADQPSR